MSAEWELLLCDGLGNPLAELTRANGRQITFKRNAYSEAQFQLSHQAPEAELLLNAVEAGPLPTLRAYRRSAGATSSTLRFNGCLAPFTEDLDVVGNLTATFRSPFSRLIGDGSSGSGRYTDQSIWAEEKIADKIAESLILLYGGAGIIGNTDPVFGIKYAETSFAGLAIGTIASTVARTQNYLYANVGQEITNLSLAEGGYDFDETPVEQGTTLALFNTYASQGILRPNALLQYGPSTLANLSKVTRNTGNPITFVRLIGPEGLVAEKEDTAASAKFGRYYYEEQATEVNNLTTLEKRASALLRTHPVRTYALTPELALDNCPKPWDDFWLGDTLPLYGKLGGFLMNDEVRINEIAIVIDDNGFETAAIPDPYGAGETDLLHTQYLAECTC
jgi:hypothetical protein